MKVLTSHNDFSMTRCQSPLLISPRLFVEVPPLWQGIGESCRVADVTGKRD